MLGKERIKRLRKNKEAKTLIENFASLSLLQIAGYFFPLITLPYLARVIGVDKFGEIAFATAVIAYFQTVVDFGFNYTATRDIAVNREDVHKVSEIFSAVMWARVFLMTLSFVVLAALIFLIPKFFEMRWLLFFTFCIIPGHILFPEWLFQGLERMKYITVLNILAKFTFAVSIFIFIQQKSDFLLQPLLTALGFVVSGMAAMYIILVRYRIKLLKPQPALIISTIKGSADVFVNQLFPNLYNSFSVLLLGFWGGAYATGIFDAGSKFIFISQRLSMVISRAFFPYLSRNIHKHILYTKINLILTGIITLSLFLLAPIIVHIFFTAEFAEAITVLRILSVSLLFMALSNIYGTNYMIIQGHEKTLRNITMISSVFGFIIAWPLIYYFNFIGAAVTIAATRGVLGGAIAYEAVKLKNKKISMKLH